VNCDSIARWYRWLEYAGFGRALERRREAFLRGAVPNDVADAGRVLALGDGDGRALAKLLAAAPKARIDYVDASARMLELARTRAGVERVTYVQADALTTPLCEAEYDLIVTHFFLDCFEESDQDLLAQRIARTASPQARWLISEFRQPGWLVWWLYLFFRVTTGLRTRRLVDHHRVLNRHGFRLERSEAAWRGRLASELWALENCVE
jgi:ubiquinone/menaquinone biosynthesis C-methylase UbiE